MEFGEWLQNIRKERDIDLRSLARITGVDSSTINRTENQQTQVTLYTAFRVSDGLGILPVDLIKSLTSKYLSSLDERNIVKGDIVLSLQHVENFIEFFRKNRKEGLNVLKYHFNNIIDTLNLQDNKALKSKLEEHEIMDHYSIEDINRIMFRSPLSYRIDMKYPPIINPDTIPYVYERRGALMLRDVENYLRRYRMQKYLASPLFKLIGLTSTRMDVGHSLERVRLNDVLQLDTELDQDGKIIGMYWEACRFYATFTSIQREAEYDQLMLFDLPNQEATTVRTEVWVSRLAVTYLIVYRWYQSLHGLDNDILLNGKNN